MKLFVTGLLIATTFFTASAQVIKPYLQAPEPESVWITFKTDASAVPNVSFGTAPDALNSNTTGSVTQLVDGGYIGNYFYNTAHLINLQPNTKYYYVVHSGSASSDTLNFRTLPLPGQPTTADGHFRFLIMGDNQIQTSGRYDSLVVAAKRKVFEKWGGDPADHIGLTFMVGDQVDLGNLQQYEQIHFRYNEALSGNIPIQTTVGNHETYGSMGLNAYYAHFYLDQLAYQGISSGTENYYAIQASNMLFISLSSEHTGNAQYNWLQQVLNAADADSTVHWIVTFSHRPYEAEQYVGDISTWVKNAAVPLCMTHSKYLMHVGAHHHLYARGQMKDAPVYNIISGGTAWDQYWGQSNEQDFDCVQKTISNWCYQIVDVDIPNGKVDVETYSIGSPIMFASNTYKNNQLVDAFHRYRNMPAPNQPQITSNFGDSLQLPFTIATSSYATSSTELLNSTEFQIAQTADFSVMELDKLRDYENLFGQAPGQPADSSQDLNAGVDITQFEVPAGLLPNGRHYVRVRHRDRNLEWSAWSTVDSFFVYNSFSEGPSVMMDSNYYELGTPLQATYVNGPGNATDWIGLYHLGNVPGSIPSTAWAYCNGVSGVLSFSGNALTASDMYYAGFFELDGYSELAPRDTFYYGKIPVLTTDTNAYALGDVIPVYIANAPAIADSVEILKVGFAHGEQPSAFWGAVSTTSDTLLVSGLPKGYYAANYYFKGQFEIGATMFFSVGDTITQLWIDQPVYELGEDIVATWTDAPGIVKDWLGIYHNGDDPNTDPLVIYSYFGGVANGSKTLTDTLVPSNPGEYFIVMFTNDSYTEVSNRKHFTIVDPSLGLEEKAHGMQVYPNPVSSGEELTLLASDYPIEWLQLRDINGKVVYRTENAMGSKFTLLTGQLATGTYTLEVQTRKLFRYKIIVN